MYDSASLTYVVSLNVQLSAAFKEQQALCEMFDHVQFQSVRGRAGFGTFGSGMSNWDEATAL